ncbi:MAG: LysR family transcriptional regulator [Maritimibacter sp.]|nr:LysR family transcriptional regulator [Maritimibacter sp.]
MDWRSVKFDWNRARAFLVTAEEGSLSAAARALGMAQPTLGRQVSALEAELGLALFERAAHGLVLTPSGLELLDHVRAMGEAAGRMSLAAGGRSQEIEGTICISASELYAAHLLPPIVAQLRQQAPGIEVEIVASNAAADLRRREADIALRNFRPEQPDLVARRLRDDHAWLYATPEYLKRIGNPTRPEHLSKAEFVGFDTGPALLRALNALGLDLSPANIAVTCASQLVQWHLVRAGTGIGLFPETLGATDPGICRVPVDLPPLDVPLWLTAHRELNTSRRVRLVFDLIANALSRS